MIDLKVVDSHNGVLSAQSWPEPFSVAGTYSLVQQVFKCLVTNTGEDRFDTTYGSGLRSQIIKLTGQQVERVKQIVGAALQKVVSDLSEGSQSDDPAERLVNLQLIDLAYQPEETAWAVKVNVISAGGSVTTTFAV